MSEQPPRTAPSATTVARALVLADDDIGVSLRQIDDVTRERTHGARDLAHLVARNFALAHQEEVRVVARQRIVEWRLDGIARSRRPHQAWRDDDGEIGFVLLVGAA